MRSADAFPITDRQYRLLRSALREGYFEHPPRIGVLDLAEMHDVEREEVLAELRTGLDAVLRSAFAETR
ncbi:MAG: helix-turn-helix domain-containing protein [Halanaeroarchaeum sp.]